MLDHPEQLGLHLRRQFPYLVQTKSGTVGEFEPAHLPGIGPGKRPLLPAEQFALHQIGRQGSAVDGDQRTRLARAHLVDGGGNQLLPCTGFTQDENCRVRRGDLLCTIKNILEAIALPEDVTELMSPFDLLTEIDVLGLELVLQGFDLGKSRPNFSRPLPYPHLQFLAHVSKLCLDHFSVGNVADIALDDITMVDLIDIADKFHGDLPPVLCFEWDVFVTDVTLTLKFPESRFARLDIIERAHFPELLSHEVFMSISQHICQEGIYVGYLTRVCIEDQDPVLGRFEESPVARFRDPQVRFGVLTFTRHLFQFGNTLPHCLQLTHGLSFLSIPFFHDRPQRPGKNRARYFADPIKTGSYNHDEEIPVK